MCGTWLPSAGHMFTLHMCTLLQTLAEELIHSITFIEDLDSVCLANGIFAPVALRPSDISNISADKL